MIKSVYFHNYNDERKPIKKQVNVIFEGQGRLDIIIVELDGHYCDFYENCGYKMFAAGDIIDQREWDDSDAQVKYLFDEPLKKDPKYFEENLLADCF